MSNPKDSDHSSYEDEYQYPASEGVENTEFDDDASHGDDLVIKDPAQSRLQQAIQQIQSFGQGMPQNVKRGLFVALVLIVIAGAISFFSSIEHKNQQAKDQVAAAELQAQQALALKKIKINQNLLSQQQKKNSDLQSSLRAANRSNAYLREEVQKLRSSAQSMGAAQTEALKKKIQSLNAQIAKLKAQIAKIQTKPSASSTQRGQAVSIKAHYKLNSIVDGRAWVVNDTGRVISLAVGDHLRDFGVIASINVAGQYVESRDGQRIEFGLNVQ